MPNLLLLLSIVCFHRGANVRSRPADYSIVLVLIAGYIERLRSYTVNWCRLSYNIETRHFHLFGLLRSRCTYFSRCNKRM